MIGLILYFRTKSWVALYEWGKINVVMRSG